MLNWLMLALVSGTPTGFGSTDLDLLADGLSMDAHLLLPALDQRLQDLVTRGGFELAADSMELLAPLAERIGLSAQRAALEDEAFRILEPDAHDTLVAQLPPLEADRADLARVHEDLESLVPNARIESRVKSLWSLQKKMRRKGQSVDAIYDRLALRVVLDDTNACYELLGQLLQRYDTVPDELDDYIASPKASGYQALHVAVDAPVDGRLVTVEVQIKTLAMHEAAEHGPAAHWRYKAA